MKPHEICKKHLGENLTYLSEQSGESIQTLNNWAKNKPRRFLNTIRAVKNKPSMVECEVCGNVIGYNP